jgi:hypothetical protein
VSEKRLSLTEHGQVRYSLKNPWRDGNSHVIFEPLDFIARLAALIPKPRVNLTRFHGVFAPNSNPPIPWLFIEDRVYSSYTPVKGSPERIIAVFSYYENEGVRFSDEENLGFYGRKAG